MNKLSYEKLLPKSIFYSLEEIESLFNSEYKKNFTNSLVLKDEELFNIYKNSKLIKLVGDKGISKILLHDLLTKEGMYKYLLNNLDKGLQNVVNIDYIIDKNEFERIIITRKELALALSKLVKEFSEKENMHYSYIKEKLSINALEKKYSNQEQTLNIDGEYLNIKVNILLNILTMDESTFTSFMNGNIDLGYDKDYLLYALIEFVEKENIFIKYVLPKSLYNRYLSINDKDFPSSKLDDEKNILDDIKISKSLRTSIIYDAKKTYSNLEMAIYYYIKLCEVLTFNQDYFLDKYEVSDDVIERVNKVTTENNEIISLEFALIFAKLLDELEINCVLDKENANQLIFKIGDYIISLTSLDNINKSDLINVKVNDIPINLICLNDNITLKNKFKELIIKIQNEIMETKQNRMRFKDSLYIYHNSYINMKLSTKEKLFIFLKHICNYNLKGLDIIAYEKKIFANLFPDANNIKINFICLDEGNYISPLSIVSIFDNNEFTYFVINPNKKHMLQKLTKEELENKLNKKEYLYLDEDVIPGITNKIGEKYVRKIKK